MKPYPLLMSPLLRPKVWGGSKLARWGKAIAPGEAIGESWELADLPASIEGGRSVIANGPWAGHTLREATDEHESLIMGAAKRAPEGGFPLLLKYLDARENLSVQVHPDAAYVSRHPGTHLKSEAWYVLDADEDAVIYVGLREGVTLDEFERRIRAGADVGDDLNAIEVRPGDVHYLPCGTLHALGAGVVVAEVQTPSDTTFRAFDWGRTSRKMHLEETMECLRLAAATDNPDQTRAPRLAPHPHNPQGLTWRPLVETTYFTMGELHAESGASLEIVTNEMPILWMVVDGAGSLSAPDVAPLALSRGDTVLLPAALRNTVAAWTTDATVLEIDLPSPLTGMIA